MLKTFFKYQSLGNDFVLFDLFSYCRDKSEHEEVRTLVRGPKWANSVRAICHRNFGIGADGVLVLRKNREKREIPEILIFNADGSQAEICLNGLRCVALHLFQKHNFSQAFTIIIGDREVSCCVNLNISGVPEITTNVGSVAYLGSSSVSILAGTFEGHRASIGNPHFIVFQEVSSDWLKKYGGALECHKAFKNKTNVEFVWACPYVQNYAQDKDGKVGLNTENSLAYNMLVHERGCGMTLACSSGAACVTAVLQKLFDLKVNQKLKLCMPGGNVTSWVSEAGDVFLQAPASLVFVGNSAILDLLAV